MCNLIRLNQFKENSECAICYEDFRPGEEQWNHVGGERHEPFHKNCLKRWVITKAECPFDRTPLNRNSLLTRTERIFRLAKPILTNAALAAIKAPIILVGIYSLSIAFSTLTEAVAGATAIAGTVAGSIAGLTAESVGAGPTTALAATLATGIAVGLGTGRICFEAGAKAITALAAKTRRSLEATIPRSVQEAIGAGRRQIGAGIIAGMLPYYYGLLDNPTPSLSSLLSSTPLASGVAGVVTGIATWWRHR